MQQFQVERPTVDVSSLCKFFSELGECIAGCVGEDEDSEYRYTDYDESDVEEGDAEESDAEGSKGSEEYVYIWAMKPRAAHVCTE